VCLALPQDVQTMAFDCPEAFFLHPVPCGFAARRRRDASWPSRSRCCAARAGR
jgi:TPP-dependent trihydroxycyclohexane-1,2-dione (THcHDO) dehydratase